MAFGIGVIGAGTHGARYLRHAIQDVDGMGATALCRRNAEAGAALAGALGCRAYTDAADLVADPAVDGVIICTPPSTHFELARAVLAAGKPLLLEKPMTGTLVEAERLVELDARADHRLMLAQTLRWNPVLLKVRELWSRLGPVRLVRAAQRLEPTRLPWQQNPDETVGGSVLLTGVHIFDTVRWLTGAEFTTVDSRQERYLNPVVEDFFLARAQLSDGAWADMEVSKFTRSRACWLEAVGQDGQLWADYLNGGIRLRAGGQEEYFDISAKVPTLPQVLAAWLKAVRDGTAPPVGSADGLATLQVTEACYGSAIAKRAMTLD